jgi:hypothetical protein
MRGFPRELRRPRFYRLLARPPFTVAFPSIVFCVEIRPVDGAPQHRLVAEQPGGGVRWTLAHGSDNLEIFERSLYETGFELMHPTAPSSVLEKLCSDGRAERIQ